MEPWSRPSMVQSRDSRLQGMGQVFPAHNPFVKRSLLCETSRYSRQSNASHDAMFPNTGIALWFAGSYNFV
jgi:hypothetical protein